MLGSVFIEASKEKLLQRMKLEYRADFILPLHLDLVALLGLTGNLHLALRHPANTGSSAEYMRDLIKGILERLQEAGFPAHAEAIRLGADQAYDEVRGAPR